MRPHHPRYRSRFNYGHRITVPLSHTMSGLQPMSISRLETFAWVSGISVHVRNALGQQRIATAAAFSHRHGDWLLASHGTSGSVFHRQKSPPNVVRTCRCVSLFDWAHTDDLRPTLAGQKGAKPTGCILIVRSR